MIKKKERKRKKALDKKRERGCEVVVSGGTVEGKERNWQRRSSRVVPRKLQGKRRAVASAFAWAGGEEVGTRVHLTRTVVRACGRRINRCHHGDRTLVARRHSVIPWYDRPLRRPHLPTLHPFTCQRGVCVYILIYEKPLCV
ncbi:hypothetical protein QTP88_009034 [Uroleucon formosanum]